MAWWHNRRCFDPQDMDYPGTAYFIQARRHLVPRTPRVIRYVVIHITGGPATTEAGAVNEFLAVHTRLNADGREVAAGASAHYIVNREGIVIQMVREAHIANHVVNMQSPLNAESIGIEHVNPYNATAQMAPTERQYRASARLVRWLCLRYGIPMVHQLTPRGRGIIGHEELEPNTGHVHCPNPAWDWNLYIPLVNQPDMVLDALSRLP